MYGQNESEPYLKDHDGLMLDVKEIFSTIQGEGPYAGRRATFVRLGGCHLKCYFCDTDFSSGRKVTPLAAIVSRVRQFANELVVLTGGEPMRQNLVPLIAWLTSGDDENVQHTHVQIETAGNFWQQYGEQFEGLIADGVCSVVVSPKTAMVHRKVSELADAWKYIIGADDDLDADGLPLTSTQEKGRYTRLARPDWEATPARCVYVQPRDDGDGKVYSDHTRRCVELVRQYGYVLSLQQHKIVGVP